VGEAGPWSPPRVRGAKTSAEFLAAIDRVIVEHRAEVEPATLLAKLVRDLRAILRHLDGLEARMTHDRRPLEVLKHMAEERGED
jgi:hypothetical protein